MRIFASYLIFIGIFISGCDASYNLFGIGVVSGVRGNREKRERISILSHHESFAAGKTETLVHGRVYAEGIEAIRKIICPVGGLFGTGKSPVISPVRAVEINSPSFGIYTGRKIHAERLVTHQLLRVDIDDSTANVGVASGVEYLVYPDILNDIGTKK